MAGTDRALLAAIRTRFAIWTAFALALLAVFFLGVLPDLHFETDILSLLPKTQHDPDMDAALDAFSVRLGRTQLFLIGAKEADAAQAAAHAFVARLRAAPELQRINLEVNGDLQQRFQLFLDHQGFLLSPADLHALQSGDTAVLEQQALRAAYTPAGLGRPVGLAEDPLGFVNRFLQAQTPALGNARLDGAVATVERGGWTYVFASAETVGSPFAAAVEDVVVPLIESAKQAAQSAAKTDIRVLSSGALQHAAAATQRANHELFTFGTMESLGVVLLLWTIFGGPRPLILASITLGFATAAALTAVHFIFHTVQITALVFGSSLIGGVIDYSIHFFADRFRDPERWTSADAIKHVGGVVLIGLTTTLIGYVVLALVPFPGLTQIAVFCAVGLAAGCGCVLCWYPVLATPSRKPPPAWGAKVGLAIDRFLMEWRWTRARVIVVAAATVFTLLGVTRIQIQDDVRTLQVSPPHLVLEEKQVRELLGTGVETRFFVVTAASEQAVLEAEQRLTDALDGLIAQGALRSYQAVSKSVPSRSRQELAHRLLASQVYAPHALLDRVLDKLGFPAAAIEKRRAEFTAAVEPLQPEQWLKSPAAESLENLWLGKVGERYASIVALGGIRDVEPLAALQITDVRLVDRVASTSAVLSQYRRIMSWLLTVIYIVAGSVLAVRFGWRAAPRMLLPSAFATLLTVGIFGWIGVSLNLFVLLGLWLVLGLGIDYGIFLKHGQDTLDRKSRATAVLSVTLSACTTLLAFGPLAFSATPFIHSIGLTLLCAIMLSWVLVMFSCLTTSGGGKNVTSSEHG